MDEEGGSKEPIFLGVRYTLLPTVNLDEEQREIITSELQANGGDQIELQDDGAIDLDTATHIISDDVDFPQYRQALERGLWVVKITWVTQSCRRRKRASERQHSPDPGQFFQDLVVTFGDIPEGDQDAIIAGVMAMGGQYSNPLSKLATHLVTNSMGHHKCQLATENQLKCKIVTPHWFSDCLILGKKIDDQPYLFPDPAILRNPQDKPPNADSSHMLGATDPLPTDIPSSTPEDEERYAKMLAGRRILFSDDLNLQAHLQKSLHQLARVAGATIVESVVEADIVICVYRGGDTYVTASRARKDVGNLAWFYYMLARGRYSDPCARLLHYPVPQRPLAGFENLKISVSSYTGEARMYLQQMATHAGAEFTKAMKQDNTHLIASHMHSEKVKAAQEWGVNLVNHLWLEESYAKCSVQSLTNPRYTHFPPQTDLSHIVGHTAIDLAAMERLFFPKTLSHATVAPVLNSSAMPSHTPGSRHIDAPTPIAEDVEPTPAKKGRGRGRKSMDHTPRMVDDEKENESPVVSSGGRACKIQALRTLSEQADDIARYEKEKKRKGGVTHGGRPDQSELSSPSVPFFRKGKRKSDEMTYEATMEGSMLSDGETQQPAPKSTKKPKHTSSDQPSVVQRMMVTGCKAWIDNSHRMDEDKRKLRALGVEVTEDPTRVDILVAPKILRTRKFVSALASAPLVVDISYLERAIKQNRLPEEATMLSDPEAEAKFGFQLSDSLARACENRRSLFKGWTIYVVEDVNGGVDTYKEIIATNGGKAQEYRTRATKLNPRVKGDDEMEDVNGDEDSCVYLVSGDTENDKKAWKVFIATAEKQGLSARVVKTDWLLTAAMSQEITYKPEWEYDRS